LDENCSQTAVSLFFFFFLLWFVLFFCFLFAGGAILPYQVNGRKKLDLFFFFFVARPRTDAVVLNAFVSGSFRSLFPSWGSGDNY